MANSLEGKWTDDDVKRLTELCEGGITQSDAAVALGRSKSSVACKARRLNLWFIRDDSWSDEELKTLREMAHAGKFADEIAYAVGRSSRAVKSMARFWGIRINTAHDIDSSLRPSRYRDSWTMSDDKYLEYGLSENISPEQLASELGRSVEGVYSRMSKLGLTRISKAC